MGRRPRTLTAGASAMIGPEGVLAGPLAPLAPSRSPVRRFEEAGRR
jgi:hypothetical protein